MQFTGSGMTVMNRGEVVTPEKIVEVTHKPRQVLWVDRSIFNHRHRFRISWYIGEQTERSFAQNPDALVVFTPNRRVVVSEISGAQFSFEASRRVCHLTTSATSELDCENSPWIALHKKAILPLFEVGFGTFEDASVDPLPRKRGWSQCVTNC